MSKINDGSIHFLFNEKHMTNDDNETEIQQMIEEFNEEFNESELNNWQNLVFEDNSRYLINKNVYGNDELFYDKECTIKDLLKICSYYGIDKEIKSSKCKKQDIIETIVYFENLPENIEIVQKRNRMWAYITELLNDTKMKKYIIWN